MWEPHIRRNGAKDFSKICQEQSYIKSMIKKLQEILI